MAREEGDAEPAPSWVELNIGALRGNLRAMRAALDPRAELIAVVKADAYGHGAARVARTAAEEGVRRFAVAHPREATALRDVVPESEILVIGAAPPEFVPRAIQRRIVLAAVDLEHAR